MTDEEWEERLRILEDARSLKAVAQFFLHPEKPVETERTAKARCYFDRPSAPAPQTTEEAEEEAAIMEDLKALKTQAAFFQHPEKPIKVTDATACGRNYFSRASAIPQESGEDAEERAQILAETQALKQQAIDFMHPERPVVTTDSTATARCYFDRASAPDGMSEDDAEEMDRVLADMKALKAAAVDYLHPERPLEVDPTVFARNYFARASAPEQTTFGASEERARILAEAQALKEQAVLYRHPEKPVESTDATMFGRNYFTRASAPEQESYEDAEARMLALADAKALKEQAVLYHHPEKPVKSTDTTMFGRNYFTRPSAPDQESMEDSDEKEEILREARALKQQAVDYAHPEMPVATTDPTIFGRNYFSRHSAPEQESTEDAAERARILEEAQALKKQAFIHRHPEEPIKAEDASLFGRNYFGRASAPEQESELEADERAQILADAKALKQQAVDFMHPEKPVITTDPTASARCFFDRASAAQQESAEDAEERAMILADAMALKKLAVEYHHPEVGVVSSPTACGRNFFNRPAAHYRDMQIHTFPAHEDELDHDDHHDHDDAGECRQ